MSMSLDGFIAGPNAGPGNGLGDGGHRRMRATLAVPTPTASALGPAGGVNRQVVDEFMGRPGR